MWYRYSMSKIIDEKLYHTTSLSGLIGILSEGVVNANPFASFSTNPIFHGDIRGKDVVIVFNATNLRKHLMEVLYDQYWSSKYPEHADYIAGEGWKDMYYFDTPEDFDENDENADDLIEDDYDFAAQEAFESKYDENEWITKIEKTPVPFSLVDILYILAKDNQIALEIKYILKELKINTPVYIGDANVVQ